MFSRQSTTHPKTPRKALMRNSVSRQKGVSSQKGDFAVCVCVCVFCLIYLDNIRLIFKLNSCDKLI